MELKRTGKNLLGRCPFHPDDTASLSVNPETQLGKCFGCDAGGDVLSFLQLREELPFPAAVDRLKTLAGDTPVAAELMERMAHLWHQAFWESPLAQDYLKGRGLDDRELWQAFRVGYCDGSLADRLPGEGPVHETLRQLGLVNAAGQEHFRGCLVVPLTHPDRGVVGFYGRRLAEGGHARLYLPGPRQGVLNWSALKSSSSVVLTESVLDALSLWRAGVREVSCLHGVSGLPRDLSELLKRFRTREAVLCLDGDRAGRGASHACERRYRSSALAATRWRCRRARTPTTSCGSTAPPAPGRVVRRPAAPRAGRGPLGELLRGLLAEVRRGPLRSEDAPPFSSRLLIRLRGQRGEAEFVDKVDLYLARSRASTARELAREVQLQRFEAERHLKLILESAEGWVKEHHRGLAEAPRPRPRQVFCARPRATPRNRRRTGRRVRGTARGGGGRS